jgi:hypothetical protein
VVREYFPLITDGQVRGVVGVWRDAAPILATLDAVRWNVVLVTPSGSAGARCGRTPVRAVPRALDASDATCPYSADITNSGL